MVAATAWVLLSAGGNANASGANEAILERVRLANPAVHVALSVFGDQPNIVAVLRRCRDQGHAAVTLVPLWLTLAPAEADDLWRTIAYVGGLVPGLSLALAAPAGEHPAIAEAVAAMALGATPIDAHDRGAAPVVPDVASRRALPIPAHRDTVLVCSMGSCLGLGSWRISEAFESEAKSAGLQDVRVLRTSCLGRCGAAPLVQVRGTWYGGISAQDAREIVQEHLQDNRVCERMELIRD